MDSRSAEWKYTSTSNNDLMEIHLGKVKTGQRRVSLIGLPIKTLRSADRGGYICDRRMMRPCSGRHLSLKCMTRRKLNDLWSPMKHVVILEPHNSDQRCMCVERTRAYLRLWMVRVMVTQKFKEAQPRPALNQTKTPLTMTNTWSNEKEILLISSTFTVYKPIN